MKHIFISSDPIVELLKQQIVQLKRIADALENANNNYEIQNFNDYSD